ncbi:MAG: Npt1/Npt2 family nucleotide transporter [Bryobacteraceae bacterium]
MDPSVLESHQSFPVFRVQDGKQKGRLDRILSVFADVRAGEGAGALLLAANAFVLLGAYYVLKTVRDALILSQFGPVKAAYASVAQAILLVFLVPAYGAFASRVVRTKLISWVTVFFASHLVVFAALDHAGIRVGAAFYLWLGIVNYLLVGQFWGFANDLYDEHKGKRLFPLVGMGTATGGVVGAALSTFLFKSLGPYGLMIAGGAALILSVLLTLTVNHRESADVGSKQHRIANEPIGRKGGFRLVFTTRYLFLIAILILVLNLVNTTGQNMMNFLANAQAQSMAGTSRLEFFGRFAGSFNTMQNLMTMILQLFIVSRIFRYFGVRAALFVLPAIALGGYALALALPVFGLVRAVKVLENSTDYSIQNTARQALFLPTSREAKYKAKNAIDTFFTRAGDALAGALFIAGTQPWLGLQVRHFAALNVLFVLAWIGLVVAIGREHKRMCAAAPAP